MISSQPGELAGGAIAVVTGGESYGVTFADGTVGELTADAFTVVPQPLFLPAAVADGDVEPSEARLVARALRRLREPLGLRRRAPLELLDRRRVRARAVRAERAPLRLRRAPRALRGAARRSS